MTSVRRAAAWLLATSALCAPALAQAQTSAQISAQAEGQDAAVEVSEIVVTGQREAQRAAIAVKRRQFEVMDLSLIHI